MALRANISRPKEIAFTLITWVAVLWAVNFVCGLIVQNRYIALDAITEKIRDQSYGYYLPGQDKILLFPGLPPYHVRINPLGLRSTGQDMALTIDKLEEKYRILTVGDSITFGLFVDDEQSYPYQLQQLLDAGRKNAVVLNAGIGATSIGDHRYYLQKRGFDLKPDLIILNFCTNDLGELEKNTELQYDRIQKDGLRDLGDTFKLAKFMRLFRKAQLDHKFNRNLKKEKDPRVREILETMSPKLEDSLYVISRDASPYITDPESAEARPHWQRYLKTLEETVDELHGKNIDVIVFIYPDPLFVYDRVQGRFEPMLRDFLARKHVPVVDMVEIFKTRGESFRELYNYPPRDFHLSGTGNRILAEAIYARLEGKI